MNNPMIDLLCSRRSIRAFDTDRAIPDDVLTDLLTAGASAPSGMGRHTWKFTAVVSQDKIQKLAAAIGAELGREHYDLYRPAALIIPSNDRESLWGKEDNACALENIFLAAHACGIGSVWINQLQNICDVPAIRALLTAFKIPEDHVVYGMAAVGYPKPGAPAPSVEKPHPFEIIR